MKAELQRIAIAEACGLEWRNMIQDSEVLRYEKTCKLPFGCLIPNYLNDLNAMHEAEKVFPDQKQSEYEVWLRLVLEKEGHWRTWHATAAQRAEAFLKTIGKWKE